jgi:hypothetical protein
LTPTREMSESCSHRTGGTRLQALPEPLLQGVEADEARIRAQEQVLMSAVLGSLPGELQGVDEHETGWDVGAELGVRNGVGG